MARQAPSHSDPEESAPRSSLADVLRRRWWGGLIAFLLVFVPVASLVYFLPDVYRSSTTVLIERQQIPDDLVKSTVTGALDMRLSTINAQILSRPSLVRIIRCHGLYDFNRVERFCKPLVSSEDVLKEAALIPETVIDQMRQDVKIDLKGGDRRGDRSTVAFVISYRGRQPETVAAVARELADSYIRENDSMRSDQAQGTARFLKDELASLSEKLKTLETRVGDFKAKHIGELPEQLDANLKTLDQLNTQLRVNSENMTRASERRANLERELASALGGTTPTGPGAVAMRLAELRGTLASLQTRYSEKHPEVVRVRAEIATLESRAGEAGPAGGGPGPVVLSPQVQQLKSALLEAEVQIKGLDAEAANLKRQLAVYQTRVESVPRVQQEYQALARDYETTREMHRSLTLRQSESALSANMEGDQRGEQFKVIEPAFAAQEPAAPKRPRLFAVALLLALAAAGAAIFGPEALDSTVHSLEQLQARCGLPVLVAIPRIVGPADVQRQRRRFALVTGGLSLVLAALVVGTYLLAKENPALTALLIR